MVRLETVRLKMVYLKTACLKIDRSKTVRSKTVRSKCVSQNGALQNGALQNGALRMVAVLCSLCGVGGGSAFGKTRPMFAIVRGLRGRKTRIHSVSPAFIPHSIVQRVM